MCLPQNHLQCDIGYVHAQTESKARDDEEGGPNGGSGVDFKADQETASDDTDEDSEDHVWNLHGVLASGEGIPIRVRGDWYVDAPFGYNRADHNHGKHLRNDEGDQLHSAGGCGDALCGLEEEWDVEGELWIRVNIGRDGQPYLLDRPRTLAWPGRTKSRILHRPIAFARSWVGLWRFRHASIARYQIRS